VAYFILSIIILDSGFSGLFFFW